MELPCDSVTRFRAGINSAQRAADVTDIVAGVVGRYPAGRSDLKSIDLSAAPPANGAALFIRYVRREKSGSESFRRGNGGRGGVGAKGGADEVEVEGGGGGGGRIGAS